MSVGMQFDWLAIHSELPLKKFDLLVQGSPTLFKEGHFQSYVVDESPLSELRHRWRATFRATS